ncbi:ABC transporter permease subunit [Novisyntrophococcus fermenticellae]|uniref:ABC transporter permease subunit n=1 Tax=Novisyntrophococcus fermenticellae TaxID=2068655 RepID=UPI001E3DF7D9|nr:ABC transporter permease subunit [Novisyntrophococcus fermenticellae]
MEGKVTKIYSSPLMKQNIKSNYILTIAIVAVMCMMTIVSTYATSIMQESQNMQDTTQAQADFYSYLYVMASYNDTAGTQLSFDDFEKSEDKSVYEAAFEMADKQSADMNLSKEGLETAANVLKETDVSMDTYTHLFEYTYALGQVKGCFSGGDLDIQDMMNTMLETMGIDPEKIETLQDMDTTAMFNQMDYTIMGLLPIFIFIVIVGNSLIVDQVDRGSMAYVLSTPTKRSAVTNTQIIFMLATPLLMIGITCAARLGASFIFLDDVNAKEIIVMYLGMYILVEAVAGICYLGSCIFDQSRKAMGFGGGLTVWFFLASLLGMFGSGDMVKMGFGAEALDVFNKLTLVGLYDIKSISTIGSGSVDTAFIWKLAILAGISIVCYAAGSIRFQKKDLPL